MAIYKEIQLQSELFAYPIDIKLNAEDWYVRIGAPLHQVVQIRPHLFNAFLFTVNNLYGSSMFDLLADRKQPYCWSVWKDGNPKAELKLVDNQVTVHDKESGQDYSFSISPADSLSKQEQQLLAAAIMDTWQLAEKGIGANRVFA